MRIERHSSADTVPLAGIPPRLPGRILQLHAPRFSARVVALMPVASPSRLKIQDCNLTPAFMPVASPHSEVDETVRADFDRRMTAARELLGAGMAASLCANLNAAGFEASLSDGISPSFHPAPCVGDDRLRPVPAVLRVFFTDAGMATRMWSTQYEPRVNASAYLMAAPDSADWLCSEHFYYGADSSGDTAWSISADQKYRFASLESMLKRADKVADAYEDAVRMLSSRIVERVCELL